MKILETEGLLLRHLEYQDLDALYVLYSNPDMRRDFPEGTLTFQQTREEVRRSGCIGKGWLRASTATTSRH